jgi:DNA-directed RNA polymerase subunit RPC12/RpoP
MSWLSRVRSGIPFLPKRQTAENLWHKCKKCGTMVFTKEWEDNLNVCPRCDHHDRIGWRTRFEQVFDDGDHELLPTPEVREDPLRFRDSKRYTDRIKTARSSTEMRDALMNARGEIEGLGAVVGVQDFAFMGGSMGIAVGAAFVAGVRRAIADKVPYVIFTAAGNSGLGAFDAVEQYGKNANGEANKFVIGVDSNQNAVKPGFVLTSMVKRVDNAVYDVVKEVLGGNFKGGFHTFGLDKDGVAYALDQYNKPLISEQTLQNVEAAKAKIVAGEIKVTDAMAN